MFDWVLNTPLVCTMLPTYLLLIFLNKQIHRKQEAITYRCNRAQFISDLKTQQ